MTGRKKRGEPEYEWVDQLNRRQLEGLAKKLIKGKGEYTEEEVRKVIKRVCKKNKPLGQDLIKKYRKEFENLEKDYFEETEGSSDTDSLGSLDGDQDESSERAGQRESRSESTEPDFPGFGEYFDSIQSPSDLVKLVNVSTPDIEKHLSNTESGVKTESKEEIKFKFEMAEERPMTKYIQPDRYEGKGDIRDFFTRFEECAKNNKWDDEMKKEKFPLALGGLAHRYYKALIADRRERNYQELKEAFEKRYLKNKEKINNKINSRLLGEKEEIEDYYSEMVELCKEADENMSEVQMVRNIINGIPNEYKRYMNPGKIETLDQLQEEIESATTSLTLEKNTENRVRMREMEKLSKKMENIKLGRKDEVKSELFNELEKIIMERKEKEKEKVNNVKGEKKEEKGKKKGSTNFVKDNNNSRNNDNDRNFRGNGPNRGQRRNFGGNSRGRGRRPYRDQGQRWNGGQNQNYNRYQNWNRNDNRGRRGGQGRGRGSGRNAWGQPPPFQPSYAPPWGYPFIPYPAPTSDGKSQGDNKKGQNSKNE